MYIEDCYLCYMNVFHCFFYKQFIHNSWKYIIHSIMYTLIVIPKRLINNWSTGNIHKSWKMDSVSAKQWEKDNKNNLRIFFWSINKGWRWDCDAHPHARFIDWFSLLCLITLAWKVLSHCEKSTPQHYEI